MTVNNFDFTPLDLPIANYRDRITASVDSNQVTIITAETGAGKSTQVPQYLAEHGYNKIIVTQPRILAARNLSDRVRQEYSYRLGLDATNLVGFRTAHERDDAPDNVILYCTDGLQLVRELTGSGTHERQVLILDEVHEWNENMEVLIAWAKKRCQEDLTFKVVIMSATIESASLAEFFGSGEPISVEGRSFPVEQRSSSNLITEIIAQVETRTINMLVFLPGKAEIEAVAESIEPYVNGVPIIPLHSQLEPEAQQLAFANYPKGKIVLATNIAQTSVTIDDIDMVIDSGLERRAEVRSGVEGLFIEQTSQADCKQRAGRAGRTKPGIYILAQYETLPCLPVAQRQPYGVPEILRKHIDRLVLRLANIGIDIEELDFYHSPSNKTIKFAKYTLVSLGALTTDKKVTAIGREMERFPIESTYARMLVEAKKYSKELQAKLAAIIAIQEVGGIIKGGPRFVGWRAYTQQTESDLVAQYDVFLALPQIAEEEFDGLGIIGKNVDKAQEIIERLNHDLGLQDVELTPVTVSESADLLRCIVSGQLHQLWFINPDGQAIQLGSDRQRELSSSTVVKRAALVAGRPFDLQVPMSGTLQTLHLVNDLTAVDPIWLTELAPDNYKVRAGKLYFEPNFGGLATKSQLHYGNQVYEAASSPIMEHTSENIRQFTRLYSMWLLEQLNIERQLLEKLNNQRIPEIPLHQIEQQVKHRAEGVVSLRELSKQQRIELSKLAKLETYLGGRFMSGLVRNEAARHHGNDKRHWKFNPKHRLRNRNRQFDHD